MRRELNKALKEEFRELAIRERERRKFTQKQMAEFLAMSERSYADIESGASACSALTVVMLLVSVSDAEKILMKIKMEFDLICLDVGDVYV